ncbi:MAG: Planctomycete cytochrome [Prosthecobacter sp.]|nr:Planctomycete cytochrome [Prosthecobacter sp.]
MRFLCSIAVVGILQPLLVAGDLQFNRDIRPILSDHCFTCHGPDVKARKAKLRLDLPGGELKELVERIISHDADEVMPPPETNKPLSPAKIEKLKQWIAEGARYQKHWAFEPLNTHAELSSIDAIVEKSLKEHGLDSAPEADAAVLLRRVSLDLNGLPPERSFESYEAAVDHLLASPHFGENLAVGWMDAARYADTNGYFGDKPRQMWLWRDWVIKAFNANMPFDQFTIEQLAGDLLPNATVPQRIATGFNRNHMANNESGSIDEEFRTEYVVDRVDTTMTTWLGLTAGCAQCHDHKFDPISQREFYQLFAFFNNVPEQGLIKQENPPPLLEVPSADQQGQLAELTTESKEAAKAFEPVQAALKPKIEDWEKHAEEKLPAPPSPAVLHVDFNGQMNPGMQAHGTTVVFERGIRGEAAKFDATQHVEGRLNGFDADQPWSIGLWLNADGSLSCPLSLIEAEGNRRGFELIWQKGRLQVNLVHRWGESAIEVCTVEALSQKAWHQVVVSYDGTQKAGGLCVFFDGAPTTLEVRRDTLKGSVANDEPLRIGRRDSGLGFYGKIDELRILSRPLDASTANDWFWAERIRGIVETDSAKRLNPEREILLDYFIEHYADGASRKARARMKTALQAVKEVREAIPTVLVMQEMEKPRTAHVLERGQYDKPLDAVQAGVPITVAAWPEDAPRNRLGFAQWLVSPQNPLTPRVAVNRLWQLCFGEGLVRTPNDFGSQGEAPTHPELLDFLAARFRDSGWDVKALLKMIVMSKTYRQSSVMRDAGDPQNRLLARGPSGRLSAEMLRDQALALSGLLVPTVGGPSTKPFQPPGLWEAVSYNGEETYVPDKGDGLWRRSLYTYVKRQSPHPMLLTFDGPTREKCTVRRSSTNTPLQALMLLNDETFLKAAEALAKKSEGQANRISGMFRAATQREPDTDELRLLEGLLKRRNSWTVVAHTILNLDEVITKR